MRRYLVAAALVGTAAATPAYANSIGFQYTIEREHDGNVVETNFLRGFEIKDGLRLRVKLHQASYCYVIMSNPTGGYRLVFPDPGTRKTDDLAANQWARIPKSTFLRVGEDPGVERMYIIVATTRIPELEQQAAVGRAVVSESLAFEVRDRYHGEGDYTRGLDGPTVTVRYKAKTPGPAVVVEEIAVQALQSLQKAVSAPSKP
jgi:hypothetical protein